MKWITASFGMLLAAGSLVAQTTSKSTLEAAITNKSSAVKGLTAKDFKLSIDGKEETVSDAVLADRQREQVYLLVFDVATLSSTDQLGIRSRVNAFLDANARPDRSFSVLGFSGTLKQAQGFTSDAALLKAAVDRTLTGVTTPNSDWRAFLKTMTGLAQSLGKVGGRKSLLFFTNGQIPTTAVSNAGSGMGTGIAARTQISDGDSHSSDIDKVSTALNAADVTFHTISTNSSVDRSLTSATDGMFIKASNSLDQTLARITDEQDATYTLTYVGGNLKPGCHKVSLKVEGGNSVNVRNLICN
jgi:VWFA-related protein